MMQKLSTMLVVALAGGALLAGCGSSSTSTTTSTQSSSSTTPLPLTPAQVAQAQASCRQRVQAATSLSASAKAKLTQLCGQAVSTNPAAIRKATEEACVALLDASHIPAGVARERALALCRAAQ
jgi:outer membrane murein-binding lipoprotein Lpp